MIIRFFSGFKKTLDQLFIITKVFDWKELFLSNSYQNCYYLQSKYLYYETCCAKLHQPNFHISHLSTFSETSLPHSVTPLILTFLLFIWNQIKELFAFNKHSKYEHKHRKNTKNCYKLAISWQLMKWIIEKTVVKV